ncbi:hypothetical protein [Novipirellula artificiosorum]|uniref:Glycoside hydrolase family 42 N-terminal domain-containing protein n=1 Tax=Novipirellula artificiosorum TaxID=2528016 RepID=A0A5C6DN46_9BACT|nr:hypothetical protein [Novipirellula artificiosorum]TWU38198.1 hypothetical protein Poly41_26740 [Novipirellula artificiosorum]
MKRTAQIGLLIVALLGVDAVAMEGARQGYGISSWAGWKPGQVSRAECPELRSVPLILRWSQIEPAPGNYAFDKYLGEPLKAAHDDDLYVTLMIWVRPGTPEWVFDRGVPKVYTDRDVDPLGQKMDREDNLHPYYLNPEYKKRFFSLVDAFGAYIKDLAPEYRKRIVFVQSAEGSTGDGQPYKGNPLEEQYVISKDAWNAYRKETWIRYQKSLPDIPVLVNSDANTAEETSWLLENMETIALKQGMFSHGYHVSDNNQRLKNFETIEAAAKKRGIPVLTRGEMDGEMFVYGWSTRNIPQALYWSGLFATHCRLDIWNIPSMALKDEANLPAFRFFNRYAGHLDPATSPRAFCALRDGLDASDFQRFPADTFGGKPGKKRDMQRYLRIAKVYAPQGARMDDPEKAIGGGMLNRKRNGSNDVGWGIWPSNYCRFLTQIDPGSGDIGLWNIDDSIYGRFARSFDHASGKTQLRFKLDEAFLATTVKVNVTYLDRGTGSWSIGLPGQSGRTHVQNTDGGVWKTQTIELTDVAELVLKHEAGDDTVFHMIAVERTE